MTKHDFPGPRFNKDQQYKPGANSWSTMETFSLLLKSSAPVLRVQEQRQSKARVPSHGPNTSKELQPYKINKVRSGVFKRHAAKKLLPRPGKLVVGSFWVVTHVHIEQNYYFLINN